MKAPYAIERRLAYCGMLVGGKRRYKFMLVHVVTAEVIESTATQPSPIAPPWLRAMQARLNSRAMLDAMHVY